MSATTLSPEETDLVLDGSHFSVTGFTVRLERQMIPFLLQFFLPSSMFVMISWISFVIPHNSGERTGMIVTLLLVVVSMYLAVMSMSPKGAPSGFYTPSKVHLPFPMIFSLQIPAKTLTAIEYWLVCCIGFVFMSLIELGLVIRIASSVDNMSPRWKW